MTRRSAPLEGAPTDSTDHPTQCPGCVCGWIEHPDGCVRPCPEHRRAVYEAWFSREQERPRRCRVCGVPT